MKKVLFFGLLFVLGIFICSCSKKDDNSSTVNNSTNTGPAVGTHTATGTISFKIGDVSHSCTIDKVIVASSGLTIQTTTDKLATDGNMTLACYTATSYVAKGSYSTSSTSAFSSATYIDNTYNPCSATTTVVGSSCTIEITALSTTSIQGTFTATLVPTSGTTKLIVTNGVINCTVTN
jgi:hypothetical protein